MRRVLSVVMAVILVISIIPISGFKVHATGEATVEPVYLDVSDETGNAGQVVTVSLYISENSGLAAAQFLMMYDNTKLTYLSYSIGSAAIGGSTSFKPDYKGSGSSTDPGITTMSDAFLIYPGCINDCGSMINISFCIKPGWSGSTPITLNVTDFVDKDIKPIDYEISHGSVTARPEIFTDGEYFYTVCDLKATIVDYTGIGGDLDIPGELGGLPVVAIGNDAFMGCFALISVTIPDGVTAIGEYAFWFCKNLSYIMVPDSVAQIEFGAFGYCANLGAIHVAEGNIFFSSEKGILYNKEKSVLLTCPSGSTIVSIHDGLQRIADYAFYNCTKLWAIIIPYTVTGIGVSAFNNCTSLKKINIPDSVLYIEDYAFSGCTGLKKITIPASVGYIGDFTFDGCINLTAHVKGETYACDYTIEHGIPADIYLEGIIGPADNTQYAIDYNSDFIYNLDFEINDLFNGTMTFDEVFDFDFEINENSGFVFSPTPNGWGTSSSIDVILEGVVVESYDILIYGDVTGDGNMDSNDAGILCDYENYLVNWDPANNAVLFEAADINYDGNVDSNDAGLMVEVENYNMTIDQMLGLAYSVN